jgi:hypothetical protein
MLKGAFEFNCQHHSICPFQKDKLPPYVNDLIKPQKYHFFPKNLSFLGKQNELIVIKSFIQRRNINISI